VVSAAKPAYNSLKEPKQSRFNKLVGDGSRITMFLSDSLMLFLKFCYKTKHVALTTLLTGDLLAFLDLLQAVS